MEPSSWASLVAILALTLINGFFAAAETAVVSVRPSRIQELVDAGDSRARRVQKFLDNPRRFLATIQVAITILGFFAGALGAVTLGPELAKLIPSAALSVVIVTLAAAFITIVGGEVVPKSLSLQNAEGFALQISAPISLIARIFAPIVAVLDGASRVILRLMGSTLRVSLPAVTDAEVKILLEEGEKRGTIEQDEVEMIHGVFDMHDRSVRQIMTPRPDVVMVEVGTAATEALDLALEQGFSRIPVYRDSVDRVVGTVSVRDIAASIRHSDNNPGLIDVVMRKAHFVPEAKMVDEALADMRDSKVHMAVVVDEYGDTAGIVTMEDIIEEIVGEIADESDRKTASFIPLNDNEAVVDGTLSIADLNGEMDLELDLDDADTVAGLVFVTLGRVPDDGDRITVDGVRIEVLRVENTRIKRLKVTKNAIPPADPNTEAAGDD